MLKVLIPSYKRGGTIKTHLIFQDYPELFEPHIIIHNHDQEYFDNPNIKCQIHISNAPSGVVNQRNWVLENLIEDGEWFVMADDNIDEFTVVEKDYYYEETLDVKDKSNTFWNKVFAKRLEGKEMYDYFTEDIQIAKDNKAYLIGFATTPNPFFRERKYRYVGYVLSKAILMCKTDFRWDTNVLAMDDYQLSAEHTYRYGKVVINNYIKPMAKHYQAGGIGTYEARLPKKIRDCKYLKARYPGFFRYKEKSGKHPLAELQITMTSEAQVEKWRFIMKKVLKYDPEFYKKKVGELDLV
jgi:hypothetical protein